MLLFTTSLLLISAFHASPVTLWADSSAPKATNEQIQQEYLGVEINSPNTKKSLSALQRQALFNAASQHPVTRLDRLNFYDPKGEIGFCFGRAMAVHLLARKTFQLDSDSIKKLFIIGDLRSGQNPEWRFHVTTLVQGGSRAVSEPVWYAIDPIMDGPMKLEDWVKKVRGTWDRKNKARLYRVENSAIIPDLRSVPDLDKEDGTRVIETIFDPEKRDGFSTQKFSQDDILFDVNPESAIRYFMTIQDKPSENQFNFIEISVNETLFNFNNYFTDLMASFKEQPTRERLLEGLEEYSRAREMGIVPIKSAAHNLYSPRFLSQNK